MSFISFNEKYYKSRMEFLSNQELSFDEIYEAKQLLKLLDDLLDEGYTTLYNLLEEKYSIPTKLRQIIRDNGETPFPIQHVKIEENINYGDAEIELEDAIRISLENARMEKERSDNLLLNDISNFSKWIGYDDETAYVFLFRDTFLPYVFFDSKGRDRIYPWLINRKFLSEISSENNFDDKIRSVIFDALNQGISTYYELKNYCSKRILSILEDYPRLKNALGNLFEKISSKRIIVVESGYCGTIPMLLTAFDKRVDFRLFITAPYLKTIYGERVFTKEYEKIRLFETLYSQDALFEYSAFNESKFMVKICKNEEILKFAYREINNLMNN